MNHNEELDKIYGDTMRNRKECEYATQAHVAILAGMFKAFIILVKVLNERRVDDDHRRKVFKRRRTH